MRTIEPSVKKLAYLGLAVIAIHALLIEGVAAAQRPPTPHPTIAAGCNDPFLPCIEPGGEFAIPIVQQARESACPPQTSESCADIILANSNTVVLIGETIPVVTGGARSDNPAIWKAVSQIDVQHGFDIKDISITGTGTRDSPFEFVVVMAKP